ncbi:ATPase [Stenotrophomonas phage vB_SM_ytsc_ply2008005c]|uniref:ATPase n=1 Tax=Stenotrophomonas phage vB_SM_ytsc_ply2008005c TaxID=2894587 RepID=UPI0023EE2EEE|nr:ATPase [Stenotrophomonas phage vB_SM_ytsc_ply2008005c]UFJ83596.1 ATPase [Stenotrophomonas phage vB_SM_ytsc_ply2008005c]
MALKFTTTNQAAQLHGVKALVYGPSGAGKTTLCATAPSPIIISAEAGLLSLRKFQIPVIEIKTVEDLTEAHRWCSQSAEAKQFATVCIDSISEIGEVVLANAKRQVKDPRQAYGELIEKMMTTIKAFRDLQGKHVYMAAKMEPVKDEMTGIVRYMASMPGSKLGPQLPYLFDEVFRLGINKTPQGEQYRFLQTQPDLQYDAKDRSGALDAIEPPDLNHVITKILGAM